MTDASTKLPIQNIAFYRFVELRDAPDFCLKLEKRARELRLRGSVLVAKEGVNGMLAGDRDLVLEFENWITTDKRFAEMLIKRSASKRIPFRKLVVKLKNEVLTLRGAEVDAVHQTTPYVKPTALQEKLENGADVILIDVRNDFEFAYGHFKNAVNPNTKAFSDFAQFVKALNLDKNKEIITYCTGGIRCEKGSLLLAQAGFTNVSQLEGGILGYLAQTNGGFFEGTCFVFDEREALTRELKSIQPKM